MNKLVSIITPSFNSSRFIEECIDSVLSQTYDYWELLVVDDFSSDNSCDLIEKYNKAADSDGLGQGLYLATRIMESTGWKFNLLSHASEFKLVIDFNVK